MKEIIMRGYKVLDKYNISTFDEVTGYRLNKWYKMRRNIQIKPYERGYHFYDTLFNLISSCYINDCNVYEIIVKGTIKKCNEYGNYVSSEIKLVRKLPEYEIYKFIQCNLDRFIKDENYEVRLNLAKLGYGLDKLVYDKDWHVREEVAKRGYGLEILINDENEFVRRKVARNGYKLDVLINDKDWTVRYIIAKLGYGLDKLVHDEYWRVREAVAHMGYGLDILIKDQDHFVQKEAKRQLELRNKN